MCQPELNIEKIHFFLSYFFVSCGNLLHTSKSKLIDSEALTPQLGFGPCLSDVCESQRAVIKQLIRQSPLGRPRIRLGVEAVKIVRVLHDVAAGNETSTGDVEFVFEDGGRVVHPPLLQVGTLDEAVGLGVVRDDPAGVSCDREKVLT